MIVILTNIMDKAASTIAKMYRARWNIEIFFKMLKQNLREKKYYGESENAVKTQIWIAFITYLLFMRLKENYSIAKKRFFNFISELKISIFQRSSLELWFKDEPEPSLLKVKQQTPEQLSFHF